MTPLPGSTVIEQLLPFSIFLPLCFLPTIYAYRTGRRQRWAIFLLNLLTGLTGLSLIVFGFLGAILLGILVMVLGWIAALVWAAIKEEPMRVVDKA